jgi:hypothetical protein
MTLATGSVVALALAGSACNRDARHDTRMGNNGEGTSMTLTGCLQRGDDADYILTAMNRAEDVTGTTGSSSAGDQAARQQMTAAAHTFRLEGKDDELGRHVGKQIRVTGTVDESGELEERTGQPAADRPDIGDDDVAEVRVTSVEMIAETCGAEGR